MMERTSTWCRGPFRIYPFPPSDSVSSTRLLLIGYYQKLTSKRVDKLTRRQVDEEISHIYQGYVQIRNLN